jgi:hypothetical protein
MKEMIRKKMQGKEKSKDKFKRIILRKMQFKKVLAKNSEQ